jgi:hypothetical protein
MSRCRGHSIRGIMTVLLRRQYWRVVNDAVGINDHGGQLLVCHWLQKLAQWIRGDVPSTRDRHSGIIRYKEK